MPREIRSKSETALAICGGQLLLLPKVSKPLPDYLADHPDITSEMDKPKDTRRFEVVEAGGEPVRDFVEDKPARPAGVDDLEELAQETKPQTIDDSPIIKSKDAISVVPPASVGPSTDNNDAYNSGKGISMVPPPKEVTEAKAASAGEPTEEAKKSEAAAPTEEPEAITPPAEPKKNAPKKKGKKGK